MIEFIFPLSDHVEAADNRPAVHGAGPYIENRWDEATRIRNVTVPALPALGARFFQRVFTPREREGQGEAIGKPPTYTYKLLGSGALGFGESTWEGTSMGTGRKVIANAGFSAGQIVTIQAPALPVTFLPDFVAAGTTLDEKGSRGIKPVWRATDPVDASIAITNNGIIDAGECSVTLPDSAGPLSGDYHNRGSALALAPQLEAQLTGLNDPTRNPYTAPDNNEWAADWHRISSAVYQGGRSFLVTYKETPNQARRRMMDAPPGSNEAISFHSAIPSSAIHSRRALAYDLAIGQACSIDDETFYAYLCRVADWRLNWEMTDESWRDAQVGTPRDMPSAAVLKHYMAEPDENKKLATTTRVSMGQVRKWVADEKLLPSQD